MYSLRILFFTLPLYFSHIFSGFGIVFGGTSSFERQKVYLMVILTAIALIEWVWRYPDAVVASLRKYGHLVLILLLCPFFTRYWWGGSLDSLYYWGGLEKHHGYILYVAIIMLSMILSTATERYRRQYIQVSIWSAALVALVAISQYLDGSTLQSRYPGRSISTLGNPNYLAGYLIMILPLTMSMRSPERWIIGLLLILAMITTGSYIGIVLLGGYLVYLCIRFSLYVSPHKTFVMTGIISCTVLLIGYHCIDPEKFLSLSSRWILMQESLAMMLREPLSFLIGFGPDSLISHFSLARPAIVSAYFPSNEIIDSSHNICIDILFQYGIAPIIAIGYSLIHSWKNQKEDVQIAILLGMMFLSLNVFVVVHMILFALLLSHTRLASHEAISEK